jgi:TolA-binding protein
VRLLATGVTSRREELRYTTWPMNRTSRLLTATALVSALSGCYGSTSAGRKLHADVDEHATRLQKLEAAQNAQLEQLKQAEEKAQQSIRDLEGVIERATTVVQRNSADVTVQVSDLQSKVAALEGRLAELSYALEEAKKSPAPQPAQAGGGSAQPAPADEVPADKNEHYAAAYAAYNARDFAKARSLFRAYVERYGTDAQADNAQYWLGASYLVENRPATALAELKKVIQNFRNGDAVDEALLDMAEAFYRLRACSDARNALDTLIKTQANSPLLSQAKKKLKELKGLGGDYCTS